MIIHASADFDGGLKDSILAPSPNISPKLFAKLAHDEDMAVRMGVAMNRRTPPEVLAELAHDESETVRREAYHNLSVSDNLDTDYSTTSEEWDGFDDWYRRTFPDSPTQLEYLNFFAKEYSEMYDIDEKYIPEIVEKWAEIAKEEDEDAWKYPGLWRDCPEELYEYDKHLWDVIDKYQYPDCLFNEAANLVVPEYGDE